MATLASDALRWAADQIVHHCGYTSAVLAGILPDPRHEESGGFHVSIEDLIAHGNGGDYSDVRPDDKGWNPKYGSAIDVGLSKSDMIRAFGRVHAVWADRSDPRRRFFNAINVWDGSGDATRLDFYANTAGYASPDHKAHSHNELHRRYACDKTAARALVSTYLGEPKALWIAREEPKVVVKMLPISGQIPELTKGMHDPVNGWGMVARLQKLLGVKVDGDYGKLTAEAIRAYDHTNLNRTTDGNTVDAAFWKRIYGITGN